MKSRICIEVETPELELEAKHFEIVLVESEQENKTFLMLIWSNNLALWFRKTFMYIRFRKANHRGKS